MNSQWDRHWNIICLGTITITSAVVGTAFFSANLVDLATPANTEIEFWWLGYRLLVSVLIGLVYLTMIRRSQEAIFATNFELLRRGINRRQAVRRVYDGLFLVIAGLLLLLAFHVFGELTPAVLPEAMPTGPSD